MLNKSRAERLAITAPQPLVCFGYNAPSTNQKNRKLAMRWRWDQGRLGYFQYDEIQKIAQALASFNGQALPSAEAPDTLRNTLANYTTLTFPSGTNTLWRNYGRVFGVQMLAANINGLLVCTELCNEIAKGNVSPDDYFLHFATRFYFSHPSFQGYSTVERQVFPVCAVIKLLIAKFISKKPTFTTIEEIADLVVGNDLDGTEPIAIYTNLHSSGFKLAAISERQIREFVIMFSQLSFLKWDSGKLFLDALNPEEVFQIESAITPVQLPRKDNPAMELLQLGGNYEDFGVGDVTSGVAVNVLDQEFTEGNKIRVTHLRSERSAKLRELYFAHIPNPHHCNMCSMDAQIRYPWADRIIELHHLLPLASPIRIVKEKTSLKDLVGLCPSCHRATHKYYSRWLKKKKLKDFRDYFEANGVYQEVKNTIVLAQ